MRDLRSKSATLQATIDADAQPDPLQLALASSAGAGFNASNPPMVRRGHGRLLRQQQLQQDAERDTEEDTEQRRASKVRV